MEKRLFLAIAMMIGVMILSNVIFPPVGLPPSMPPDSGVIDGLGEPERRGLDSSMAEGGASDAETTAVSPGQTSPAPAPGAAPSTDEVVVVRSELYEYRFSTRGARLVGARLLAYPNFAPGAAPGEVVELLRPGDSAFGYRVAVGRDTLSLGGLAFEPSTRDLQVGDGGGELRFSTEIEGSPLTFSVTYRFVADDYRIDVEGGLEGLGDAGYALLATLGRGLKSNEAVVREDRGQMAVVVRERTGAISATKLSSIEAGESRPVDGGPFNWAAAKSKYFLAAIVSGENSPGLGGVRLRGVDEPDAAEIEASLPVRAGAAGFAFVAYLGPQDQVRLQAVGQYLHNVNPFGWRWLQWFIRPFGAIVTSVLQWMHTTFGLAYGWVLILFGILSRVVLFPLYQKSMRQQMKQMAIQPEIKKIQEKYKDDPPKLQQEMMKVYKENHINPLGGCLPMLVPFPILITLFFVFQNTIAFRGVPFLWLPDLSLKDPLYIVPFLMGGSMLLLNWIGQRGMETNQQMKMFTYVLPVVFTFMFAQFAAGLNLYYAASNFASLPQQLYLARERRVARGATGAGPGSGGGDDSSGARSAGRRGGKKSTPGKRPRRR